MTPAKDAAITLAKLLGYAVPPPKPPECGTFFWGMRGGHRDEDDRDMAEEAREANLRG